MRVATLFNLVRTYVWHLAGLGFVGIAFLCALLFVPPSLTPATSEVLIEEGESSREAALELASLGFTQHPTLLYLLIRLESHGAGIRAGLYGFPKPESLYALTRRLVEGDTRIPEIAITFPEGDSTRDMARRVAQVSAYVSEAEFRDLARPYEGYLFPDTYFFAKDASARSIVAHLRETFDARVTNLLPQITSSGHTLEEIVTMASLIEKETRTPEARRIVSGILWKRIALHMPLQVDAVFGYINDRDTYSPTFEELRMDSPYNTYTNQGLPPGPICNPGLDSLLAALNPTETPYLYYLTGKDGEMRYAKTFAEHKTNRAQYLD